MKKTVLAAAMTALAGGALATDLIDTAQVVSSTPIIERISEPRQECSPAAAAAPVQERSVAGNIVGGLAGALLGAQIGKGAGKTVATAAGATVGSIVGDRVTNPDSERPVAGAVVGAAAGGILGAQVGKGNGQNAAAAAGAVAGSVAGDRVQNPQRSASAQPAQQCRTIQSTRDVVKGYTVLYRYNGRDITTTLPHEPGATVRVGVGVVDAAPTATTPPPGVISSAPPVPAPVPVSTPVGDSGGYQYRY